MYKTIDILPTLLDNAEKFVLYNDRRQFIDAMKALEKYCVEHKVIIGGYVGVNMLIEDQPDKDDFSYDLYVGKVFEHAKALADNIYNAMPDKLIYMETNVKNKIMTIWVDSRPMIKIYHLDKYKNVDLINLIGPVSLPARFIEDYVLCMSVEMQLIDIYRQLYRPYPASGEYLRYDELLLREEKLFGLVVDVIEERAVEGGAINVGDLQEKIVREIIKGNEGVVIIGDYAMPTPPESPRLQVVAINAEELVEQVKSLVVRGGQNTCSASFDTKLPTDLHLTKYSVYLMAGAGQTVLIDIFNSLEYELVPFRLTKNVRYALEAVLLRFKLIDVYSTRIVMGLGKVDKDFLLHKIKQYIQQIRELRKIYVEKTCPEKFLERHDRYAGTYVSDNILRKRLMVGRFPKYFPAKSGNAENAN